MGRLARNPATLAGVLALCACAGSGPRVLSPEVRLDNITVSALSLGSQTFALSFDVSNPNPFPLPVRAIRYAVMLEQERFAGGETTAGFTIPASGDGAFSISVDVDLVRSGARLASILGSGTSRPLAYQLHGSLDIALPFAQPIAFRSDGTILVHGR